MRISFFIFSLFLSLFSLPLSAQTIAEKKAGIIPEQTEFSKETEKILVTLNRQLTAKQEEISTVYHLAQNEFALGVDDAKKVELLDQIHLLREEKALLEREWQAVIREGVGSEEFATWHQPQSNLQQVIMDYGDNEFLYIMPQEIANLPISLHSNLSIPRSSWQELIGWILTENNIAIKELNAFTRELFFALDRPASMKHITNKEEDLELLAPSERVCFLFDPPLEERSATVQLLSKFADFSNTSVRYIGPLIFVIAPVDTIKELLKVYRFVHANRLEMIHRLIPLTLLESEDAEAILNLIFKGPEESPAPSDIGPNLILLKKLSNALFILGSQEQVLHAEHIIQELEQQAGGVKERTVFWYTCKHTDAEELANVLDQVYHLILELPPEEGATAARAKDKPKAAEKELISTDSDATIVVKPRRIDPSKTTSSTSKTRSKNFIVDPKTGSLILVVEQHVLGRLKELIRKLDIPKKMVQIDVILFEKKTTDQNRFGLNLLRMGHAVTTPADTESLLFKDPAAGTSGLLQFLLSKKKGKLPAFDLAYNFLMAQDNVRITSNPSVIAVNQTTARISIMDEISLSTGSREVDVGSKVEFKETFTRSQFGTTIEITPTVHLGTELDEEEYTDYVTLETQVNFDTQGTTGTSTRPPFVRREVKNQVRIADGQTVIIGGLRSHNNSESRERVPFLGEIPGLGKFFSYTEQNEITTEMFIFLTPKIIRDPKDELEEYKRREALKRPGDTPEFVNKLNEAKEKRKKWLFSRGLELLFGDWSDE